MPVSPAAFLAFLDHNATALSADEHSALLGFAADLDPALSAEALTARLSRFLLEHEAMDRRLEDHQLEDHQLEGHQLRIAGQPIKPTPAAFKTNLRNIVLKAQSSQQKDGGTTPKS
jgi:hypothetical protein